MKELTQEQAIALADTNWWEDKTNEDIVNFQLYQQRLCMPFGRFHEAVEAVLDRPVWTHEFAHWKTLQKEYEGKAARPTFEDVMAKIPEAKRIIVAVNAP